MGWNYVPSPGSMAEALLDQALEDYDEYYERADFMSSEKSDKVASRKVEGRDCPEFRVSFPQVFKAKSFGEQAAKFSIVMLFPKNVDLKPLRRAAHSAVVEKYGEDRTKWPKKFKTPFRDGSEDKPDTDGYKDHIFVSATSKSKPGLVDQRRKPITEESEMFYAGCYGKASLLAFCYDEKGNKGVSFSLQNIQKTRDGDAFSGRRPAEDEFDDIDDGSSSETGGQDFDGSEDEGLGF